MEQITCFPINRKQTALADVLSETHWEEEAEGESGKMGGLELVTVVLGGFRFTYFWLWVFVAAVGCSLAAVSRGVTLHCCCGLLIVVVLLLQSTGSVCKGIGS